MSEQRTTSWTTGGRIAVNGEYPDDWGEEEQTPMTTVTITTDDAHRLLGLLERRIEDLTQLVGHPTDDEVIRPGMLAMFRRGLAADVTIYDRVMDLIIEAEETRTRSTRPLPQEHEDVDDDDA